MEGNQGKMFFLAFKWDILYIKVNLWGIKLTLKKCKEIKPTIAYGTECQDMGVPFPIQV